MFYHYLRIFNWILTLAGMRRPFLNRSGNPCKITLLSKIWSLLIIAIIIISFLQTMDTKSSIYINLEFIHVVRINDILIDILIILVNLLNGERECIHLYTKFNEVFKNFKISERNLRMFTIKLYFLILLFFVFMLILVLQAVFVLSPLILLIFRIPNILAFTHMLAHLYVVLAVLKTLNARMRNKMCIEYTDRNPNRKFKTIRYLFNIHADFIEPDMNDHFDITFLCKMYNDLNTCVRLLEKHHSFQMLVSIWIMFSRAVIGLTFIFALEWGLPLSLLIISFLPFFWTFIGCYISDQLRKEVEQTEIIIVKHLIDFRCDPIRRSVLKIFKQSVTTNRLQFTACSLFSLKYSMLLGTFMNVITYSIILIQLFLNESHV